MSKILDESAPQSTSCWRTLYPGEAMNPWPIVAMDIIPAKLDR